ncbi:MAG: AAA family ATPase [Candidatus Eisenbacteria sp.]|nr:AAA family ATPase [Candidatus Eisenbacteria bacterium]
MKAQYWFARHRDKLIILAVCAVFAILSVVAVDIVLGILNLAFSMGQMAFMMMFQFFIMFYYLAGRTRQELYLPGDLDYTWDDYRGAPELVERMKTYLDLLKGYDEFEKAGGRPPSGILLTGPPGTGKTYLIKILAAVGDMPFLSIDCASLRGTFVGISPLKMSAVFRKTRKFAGQYGAAVLFLDEIDAIGRSRSGPGMQMGGMGMAGMGGMGGNLLTTLLIELDGLREAKGKIWRLKKKVYGLFGKTPAWQRPRVLVIGSSNISETLDAALTRPGRLGDIINIDLPHHEAVESILDLYLERIDHGPEMTAAKMAADVVGQTPAFITEAVYKALALAFQKGRKEAGYWDWRHVIAELALGLKQPLPLSDNDAHRLAVHEAGHAVAIHLLAPERLRISSASIVRYGRALGHVMPAPTRTEYTKTKSDLISAVQISLAGIVAEELFLGERMASAGGDLAHVCRLVHLMVNQGMFGPPPALISVGGPGMAGKSCGMPQSEPEVGEALGVVIGKFYNSTMADMADLLDANADLVHGLAEALVEYHELLGEDVADLFAAIKAARKEEEEK